MRSFLFAAFISFACIHPVSASEMFSLDGLRSLPPLKKGSKGDSVKKLRDLLKEKGFDVPPPQKEEVFDSTLEAVVKSVQDKYGLVSDGFADRQLYVNLLISEEDRSALRETRKLEMESIVRESALDGFDKVVIVNIPSFTMKVIDVFSGEPLLETPVVVGKPSSQTPIFKTNIVGVKYNPTWTPPPTAMKKYVLPQLGSESANWIKEHGLIIKDKSGAEIDPSSITKEEFSSGGFSISQPSGEKNALGLLKFETDNSQNIYLHDTNQRSLFGKANRAQSMGCVRVKKWLELSEIVLEKSSGLVEEKISTGKTFVERVKKLPVFMTYSLADEVGGKWVVFPDVYSKGVLMKGYGSSEKVKSPS